MQAKFRWFKVASTRYGEEESTLPLGERQASGKSFLLQGWFRDLFRHKIPDAGGIPWWAFTSSCVNGSWVPH